MSLSLLRSNSLKFKPQESGHTSRGQLQYTWAQFSRQRICEAENRWESLQYNLQSKYIFNFIGLQTKYSSRDLKSLYRKWIYSSFPLILYTICSSIFAKRLYIIFMQIDPSKELSFLFWHIVSLWQAEHLYKFKECRVSNSWSTMDGGRFKTAYVERDKKQTMRDLRGISTNWF